VAVTVDRADSGWSGQVGVVTTLIEPAGIAPDNSMAFVCGPDVMMRFAADALAARGIPVSRIRVSLERNMRCGVGWCGHCQLGPLLVCRDGPVVGCLHTGTRRAAIGRVERHYTACSRRIASSRSSEQPSLEVTPTRPSSSCARLSGVP